MGAERRVVRWLGRVAALALTLSAYAVAADAAPIRHLVANGDGLVGAPFGTGQRTVVSTLDRAWGPPTRPIAPAPYVAPCGVDAIASWHSFHAYFAHGRFAGYSVGPSPTSGFATDGGLRLGESLTQLRDQFGRRLRTSGNQGGAWFVRLGAGRLYGFLRPSGPPPGPNSRVETIEAGRVGCPALTP